MGSAFELQTLVLYDTHDWTFNFIMPGHELLGMFFHLYGKDGSVSSPQPRWKLNFKERIHSR